MVACDNSDVSINMSMSNECDMGENYAGRFSLGSVHSSGFIIHVWALPHHQKENGIVHSVHHR